MKPNYNSSLLVSLQTTILLFLNISPWGGNQMPRKKKKEKPKLHISSSSFLTFSTHFSLSIWVNRILPQVYL